MSTPSFYPGSSRKRKEYDDEPEVIPIEEEEPLDLGKPKYYLVNNQPTALYKIGAVAKALNRKPVTIRRWETEGIIPNSPYKMPSHDDRGQRRLYTLGQIEALRTIAQEEGLLYPSAGGQWKKIEQTAFKEKARKAFGL